MAAVESKAGAQQLISRLNAQLSSCLNKDNLVKSLKQAVSDLQRLKQMNALSRAMRPLSDALIKQGLLQHKDKNIRLLVATCFCEIMRVLAPDPDPHFSAEVLRDIFKVILSIFRETDDTRSPNFSARLKLLEKFDKLCLCTLMLDNRCEDLVLEMLKIFFSVVRKLHPYSMINAMSSIMTSVLEEKDLEPSLLQPLLDVIFQNLLKEAKGASAGSAPLVISVIESCTENCPMSTFLRSCISNRDIIASDVKESYHEIIYEIFRINPKMLPLVIPSLSQELLTDQVDVRIKALKLIRKLFALPGHNISQEYHPLFMEFINRFSDKSSEVRSRALSCAKAWYERIPCGKGSVEVLSAVQSRLLDFDDIVRIEAVTLVCDLARSKLTSFPHELIYHVAGRLRDKKVSVRKKALKKLLELYRDYCTKCIEYPLIIWDHFEQISCKILMLFFDKDCKEFSPQSLELVLAEDLFPDSLSIENRTKHWIYLFSLLKPIHLKALNTILSQKRRLRDMLQAYLYLWNQEKNTHSEVTDRRMRALITKMSASFPDAAQVEVLFHKLKEVKDNDIPRLLKELLNVGAAHSVRDQLLAKIGGDNPLFELLRLLSSLCLLNIFSSGHVSCIVDHLTAGDHYIGNKHLKDSATRLLLVSVRKKALKKLLELYRDYCTKCIEDPLIIWDHFEQIPCKILMLFFDKDCKEFSPQSLELVLAEDLFPDSLSIENRTKHWIYLFSLLKPIHLKALNTILSQKRRLRDTLQAYLYLWNQEKMCHICLEGTHTHAKLAVAAIKSLSGSSEQIVFSNLSKNAVGIIGRKNYDGHFRDCRLIVYPRVFLQVTDSGNTNDWSCLLSHRLPVINQKEERSVTKESQNRYSKAAKDSGLVGECELRIGVYESFEKSVPGQPVCPSETSTFGFSENPSVQTKVGAVLTRLNIFGQASLLKPSHKSGINNLRGRVWAASSGQGSTSRYVPPHLRNKPGSKKLELAIPDIPSSNKKIYSSVGMEGEGKESGSDIPRPRCWYNFALSYVKSLRIIDNLILRSDRQNQDLALVSSGWYGRLFTIHGLRRGRYYDGGAAGYGQFSLLYSHIHRRHLGDRMIENLQRKDLRGAFRRQWEHHGDNMMIPENVYEDQHLDAPQVQFFKVQSILFDRLEMREKVEQAFQELITSKGKPSHSFGNVRDFSQKPPHPDYSGIFDRVESWKWVTLEELKEKVDEALGVKASYKCQSDDHGRCYLTEIQLSYDRQLNLIDGGNHSSLNSGGVLILNSTRIYL